MEPKVPRTRVVGFRDQALELANSCWAESGMEGRGASSYVPTVL
ncbi:hypothetical protein SRABI91_00163 [Rhodococcoides fascians]|nr:hypothetical protein SRABI91_00163 [Rhodococcus fascians]